MMAAAGRPSVFGGAPGSEEMTWWTRAADAGEWRERARDGREGAI